MPDATEGQPLGCPSVPLGLVRLPLGGDDHLVVVADAEDHEDRHQRTGGEGEPGGDAGDGPTVDQAKALRRRPRRVSPLKSVLRWPVRPRPRPRRAATSRPVLRWRWPLRRRWWRLARRAEVGVGLAFADVGEVSVDVAGVGLSLRAGVDRLAGVLQEVGATLFLEGGGRREDDVLCRQLVRDVVLAEVRAPRERTPAANSTTANSAPQAVSTESIVRRRRATTASDVATS